MSTIMKPPFPVIFTKKPLQKAKLATALGPFPHISSQGGFGKTKLSSLSANLDKLKLSSPTAFAGKLKSSTPSIMIAAMSLLDEPVTFYDGYSKAISCQFKQIDTVPEGPILLGAVLPRKPGKSLSPAEVPSPPEKSSYAFPRSEFWGYKIAMRWPITLAILAGRNFPEPTQDWFCVHFFRSENQQMSKKNTIPKEHMKEFLMDLGIYSEMCEKWPSIGEEETSFWSKIYEKYGANSELLPADYFRAGLRAADALVSGGGILSHLRPGSYTKWEVESSLCDFEVDITVREFEGFYLVEELEFRVDSYFKPLPRHGLFH